nr:egg-associated peptide B [Lytechinus pictus]
FDLTGGGVQ